VNAKTPNDGRDERRAEYELDVLAEAFHTRTKADTIREAVRFAYDQLLAARIGNTSRTVADV
jgi:hypothetical protein